MPVDMALFKKQLIEKYNNIKENLIVILNASDSGNKDKKSDILNARGKPLKDVLQKLGISESALGEALRNSNIQTKIDIYPVTKEGDKEEKWIKISENK